ncbi:hypothetical protein [Deinococcus sp.]|uniref:hypothetical protein n=1 Tax=Deinococcus sp. TaxID=47478 RepID=UPI0025D3B7A5|nr:hypothetical protein [Deinococcus sp.]
MQPTKPSAAARNMLRSMLASELDQLAVLYRSNPISGWYRTTNERTGRDRIIDRADALYLLVAHGKAAA